MQEIVIVRHAKSSWKYHKLDDTERPLNRRGKRDAHEMGRRLAARCMLPELLLCSPTQRALATALILAGQMGVSERLIRLDARIYNGEVDDLLAVLREIAPPLRRVMLVGHHKSVPMLCGTLSGNSIEHMPTCAVAAIRLPLDRWQTVNASSRGELFYYDYPKNLP